MSTNFRLELIEPSARDVEGQQLFLSSNVALFRVSLDYSYVLFTTPPIFSLAPSKKIKYRSSRLLYKLQAKISGHAVLPLYQKIMCIITMIWYIFDIYKIYCSLSNNTILYIYNNNTIIHMCTLYQSNCMYIFTDNLAIQTNPLILRCGCISSTNLFPHFLTS